MPANVVVKKTDKYFEGAKRQYLPYVVEWDCARCGKRVKRDFMSHYLSYPQIPSYQRDFKLYCPECDCETPPLVLTLDVSMTVKERNP